MRTLLAITLGLSLLWLMGRIPTETPSPANPAGQAAEKLPDRVCPSGEEFDYEAGGCMTEAQIEQANEAKHVQRCLNDPNGWFCADVNKRPHMVVTVIRPDDD